MIYKLFFYVLFVNGVCTLKYIVLFDDAICKLKINNIYYSQCFIIVSLFYYSFQ